ncbi:hypothetical protein [Ureibacillus manganicus]|uniref:Uncharacterized protein n=1 Tax=Ureibacillus manganicus DSM 26584 TaxID=1384049 RepID=A0A0A3IFA9_9BACL|nr:hypothetical protein [Ureibacillus manganicus]KGR73547.1 hypothetical protein CD29_19715 [Ureibacillus manganicus DSM 26584]
MSQTTFFYNDKNRLTSIRSSTSLGSITLPFDGRNGGITFNNGNFSSRFTSSGFIGSSIKTGNHTTYFGKYGQVKDRLTPFTRRD